MTKTFFRPALLAVAMISAPALAPATASAQQYEVTGSQSINLDEITPEQAHARIEGAARKLCRPSSFGMEEVRAARDCYRRAKAGAEAQLAQIQQQKAANAPALAAASPRPVPGSN